MNLDFYEAQKILSEGKFPRMFFEGQVSGKFKSKCGDHVSFSLHNSDYVFEVLDKVCSWIAENNNQISTIIVAFPGGARSSLLVGQKLGALSIDKILDAPYYSQRDSRINAEVRIDSVPSIGYTIENNETIYTAKTAYSNASCTRRIQIGWDVKIETI